MEDWQSAEEHVDRAMELYQRGRWSEAEREFRKAISADPSRGDWQFNLGLTLEAAGRDSDALACYEAAASLLPNEAEPLLAAGCAALRLGRPADAIAAFEQATEIDPRLEVGYARRIETLAMVGRHEEAETVYFLAQQHLDEFPHCLKAMGESLLDRELLDRAGWCFREALRQDPSISGVRASLATVLAATGRPNRALQMYLQDLRDDPGNIETLLAYGSLLADLRRLPEASEKFRRVLELEPANAEAHWRLGELAARQERFDQARSELELSLQLDPDRPDAHLRLAEIRLRLGHRPEAKRHLVEQSRRISEGEPTTVGTIRRTAELYLEAGDADAAVSLLDGTSPANRDDAEFDRLFAFCLFAAGDLDRAASASRRVLRRDPGCVAAMHNLALAALEAGRLRTSWAWWRRAIRLAPGDDGLRRIRTRLVLASSIARLKASARTLSRWVSLVGRACSRLRTRG